MCKLALALQLCSQCAIDPGCLSFDIRTGWDFKDLHNRNFAVQLLSLLPVLVLILSPPCTAFSALNHLWNYPKLPPEEVARRLNAGKCFVSHAMCCARAQCQAGRYFVYEHPASASSWNLHEVMEVTALPGVHCVVFDQCMVGLRSKVKNIHMRKRTRLMTNSWEIVQRFQNLLCDKSHVHCLIQGAFKLT